jgi:glycine cleavage system T protein
VINSYHTAKASIKRSGFAAIVNGLGYGYILSLMARQSSLFDFHKSRGAVFAERNGWLLPAHFGDRDAEYNAVREAAGILDLSHRGLLQFTGPDRVTFLQGMLSNDLRLLETFSGQHATILNQQGKVLADLRVLCAMNSLYLDFWQPLKDTILEHLNRYLIADEVEIADRSEEYATLSLQGPSSEALVRDLAGQAELPQKTAHHAMLNADGAAICIVRDSYTGESGFDLIIPEGDLASVAQRLTEAGRQVGAVWIGQEALEILRIEAGIPLYGVDFSEDNLLLETGLDSHVSFTKGCYLGQEIVERVRSRGHVNKKLRGLMLDGPVPAAHGDVIRAGEKQIGTITSSTCSPKLARAIALGYVHRDYWDAGTRLTIDHDNASLGAQVSDLPFVKP